MMVTFHHMFLACVLVSGLTNLWVGHRYLSRNPPGGTDGLHSDGSGGNGGGLRRTAPSNTILRDDSNAPVSNASHEVVQDDAIKEGITVAAKSGTASQERVYDGGSSFPPIYWINLDESVSRRQTMIDHSFAPLGINDTHRVSATNIEATLKLWKSGRLSFHPDVELEDATEEGSGDDDDDGFEPTWEKHARNVYHYSEAACLLSHLDAIRQAYVDGHELALILEDDAMLSSIFRDELMDYISQAPKDWKVLQFATNNPHVIAHGSSLKDPFISWLPYHWSTRAYLVNREGMQTMLEKVHSKLSNGEDVWNIQSTYPMVVADEVIYAHMGDAYTATGLWVDTFNLESTVQVKSETISSPAISSSSYEVAGDPTKQIAMKKETRVLFEESLLVVMTVRISKEEDIAKQIQWILQDSDAVCQFHRMCAWEVNLVAINSHLMELFQKASSKMPSHIHFNTKVFAERFNKFTMIRDLVYKFEDYDLLLVKDNDQRINGFPWYTFMERRDDSTITGPLRATSSEYMLWSTWERKSQWYQFHEVGQWGLPHAKWGSKLFTSVKPVDVPFLEQYFVLFDSKFASYFFGQILIDDIVNQDSEWGTDSMWCQAAAEWKSDGPGCRLVPVASAHEDNRQIVKSGDYESKGHGAGDIFRRNPTFKRWMDASREWKEDIIGVYSPLKGIEKSCQLQELLGTLTSDPFDIQKCANRFMESVIDANVKYEAPSRRSIVDLDGSVSSGTVRHMFHSTSLVNEAKTSSSRRAPKIIAIIGSSLPDTSYNEFNGDGYHTYKNKIIEEDYIQSPHHRPMIDQSWYTPNANEYHGYDNTDSEECEPMHDWQLQSRPNCNAFHELNFPSWPILNSGDERLAFELEEYLPNDKESKLVYKTLKLKAHGETITMEAVDTQRKNALVLERTSGSNFTPNIHGYCSIGTVMDYMPHGNMHDYIKGIRLARRNTLLPVDKLRMAIQIASSLADVHSKALFFHNDVCPHHYTFHDGVFKLNHFEMGDALYVSKATNDQCTREDYVSRSSLWKGRSLEDFQEKMHVKNYQQVEPEKVDIWMMGNLIYTILTDEYVFENEPGLRAVDVGAKLVSGERAQFPSEIEKSHDPSHMAIKSALDMCWTYKWQERPSAHSIASYLFDQLKKVTGEDDPDLRVVVPERDKHQKDTYSDFIRSNCDDLGDGEFDTNCM